MILLILTFAFNVAIGVLLSAEQGKHRYMPVLGVGMLCVLMAYLLEGATFVWQLVTSFLFACLVSVGYPSTPKALAVLSGVFLIVAMFRPASGAPSPHGKVLYGTDWDGSCLDASFTRLFDGGPCLSCPRSSAAVD